MRLTSRPVGVDLFSGAGGMSLGFEQAGFDVAAAVEIDPVHAATHAFNFPQCTTLPCSISEISGGVIKKRARVKHVDVVFGGAPCQGFSLIGKRDLADPRNMLVLEFVRIVKELEASYFVFENVKGLTLGKHKAFLEEILDRFDAAGYAVRLPWRVLNANNYGVPQNRTRLILIGARRGLPLPDYPTAATRAAGTPGDLPEGPSCADALADIPDAEDFGELWRTDRVRTTRWGTPSSYAEALRCEWHFGHPRIWDPKLLTSSARADHSALSRHRFAKTPAGTVEPVSHFFKLRAGGVCNTLRAGTDAARGAFTSPRPIHYARPRCVTVREMARLHGFPDWFQFNWTKWHGARQVGNAVPPPVARAVAEVVALAMGTKLTKPHDLLPSGDPALLSFNMSEAADYWGIPLLARRDLRLRA